MSILEKLQLTLCSLFLSSLVRGQEVYIWASDNEIAVDPAAELGYGTTNSSQKFLVPDISNPAAQTTDISNWPNTLVRTQADYIFFYNSAGNTSVTSLLPQSVRNYGSLKDYSLLFITNQNFFLDNRNIGDPPTRSTQLIGTTLLGTDVSLSSSYRCFDSRLIDTMVVVVCKLYTNPSSQMRVYYFNVANMNSITMSMQDSAVYNSANPYIHQISWSGFVKSQNCDTVEEILIATDLRFNGTIVSSKGEPVVVIAGYTTSSLYATRTFGVSSLIVLAQGPTFPSFLGTGYYVHYATNAYSVVVTGGLTICKNNFFVLAEAYALVGNKHQCWTDGTIDDVISNAIHRVGGVTYTLDVRCYQAFSGLTSRVGMIQVWRDPSTEIYLRVRVTNDSVSGVQKIVYEAQVLKPAEMVVATPSTQFRTVELSNSTLTLNKNYGFQNYPRLFTIIPKSLYGVCWTNLSMPVGNGINPIPGENYDCQILEYISVDNSSFTSSDISSLIACFNITSKQYGPFITLATEVDSTNLTIPTRLLAYKRYLDFDQRPQENLTLSVYTLKNNQYSVRLSNSPVPTGITWMTTTNWPDFSFRGIPSTKINVLGVGSRFIVLDQEAPSVKGFFKNNCTILVDSLTNKIYNNPNEITVSTTTNTSVQTMTNWRLNVQYTPANATQKGFLLEDHIVEFDQITGSPTTFTIQLNGYNITRTPSTSTSYSDPMGAIGPKFSVGQQFRSTDPIFAYSKLDRIFIEKRGIFMFFTGNSTAYGVLRFDTNIYTFQYRIYPCPLKVVETNSRVFIMSVCITSTAVNISVEMTQSAAGKNLLNSSNLVRSFLLDPDYQISSVDDVDIFMTNDLKSAVVSIFGQTRASGGSPVHKHVALQYSWDDQTIYDKIGFILKSKEELRYDFLAGDTINLRCVYRDVFAFLHDNVASTPNNISLTVVNITKMSRWDYYETPLTSSLGIKLQCARNFVNIYTASQQKSTLVRIDAGLSSYARVRSVIPAKPITSQLFAFTPNLFIQMIADNDFYLIHLYLSKVYVKVNTGLTYAIYPELAASDSLTTNVTVNTGSNLPVSFTTKQMVKPSMIANPPIYIGTETIELQKKMLYDPGQQADYPVEDNFRLPMSFFDVKLTGKVPADKISSKERVRKIGEFDLWTEAPEFERQKRCSFAIRGTNDVALVDDIMMRVESSDDGFCIQLSRVSLSNNQFVVTKRQDYTQSTGMVSNCKLQRDASLFNDYDVTNRRNAGLAVNYGITCIHTYNGVKSIWMMLLPVTDNFDNTFKPSNAVTTHIIYSFSSYSAVLVESSIYLVLSNPEAYKVYYLTSVFTYGAGVAMSAFAQLKGNYAELVYTQPIDTGKPVTGITLLVSSHEGTETAESYFIEKYRAVSTGEMQLLNVTTKKNERVAIEQPVSKFVCSYQNAAGADPYAVCVYVYSSCRNALFYRVNFFDSTTSQEDYVSPLVDLEIRQVKAIYYKRFWYLVIAYSPLTGRKFLIVYKHASNSTASIQPVRNSSDVAGAELLTHDSLEITQTRIDTETVEMNMFAINGGTYLALKDGAKLLIYTFTKFQITIAGDIPFGDIANTQMVIVDHMGNSLISVSLDTFFREKESPSIMWIQIFSIAVVFTMILTGIYLFFKKKKSALEKETVTKTTEANPLSSSKSTKGLLSSQLFESQIFDEKLPKIRKKKTSAQILNEELL